MTTVASQEKPWPVIYDQRGSQSVNNININKYVRKNWKNRRQKLAEQGKRSTRMHVGSAFEHCTAFVYETGNNNALATTAAILYWIEALFEGP